MRVQKRVYTPPDTFTTLCFPQPYSCPVRCRNRFCSVYKFRSLKCHIYILSTNDKYVWMDPKTPYTATSIVFVVRCPPCRKMLVCYSPGPLRRQIAILVLDTASYYPILYQHLQEVQREHLKDFELFLCELVPPNLFPTKALLTWIARLGTRKPAGLNC